MPVASPEAVKEREAVLSNFLDHDDGRGALRELHEVHDEELQETFLCAPSRFDEADEGGDVAGTVNACEDSELVAGIFGGREVSELAVSWNGDASSWLVDGHHCWSCHEGGEECHQH